MIRYQAKSWDRQFFPRWEFDIFFYHHFSHVICWWHTVLRLRCQFVRLPVFWFHLVLQLYLLFLFSFRLHVNLPSHLNTVFCSLVFCTLSKHCLPYHLVYTIPFLFMYNPFYYSIFSPCAALVFFVWLFLNEQLRTVALVVTFQFLPSTLLYTVLKTTGSFPWAL